MDLLIFSNNFKLDKKVEVRGWDIQLFECQKGKIVIVFDGKVACFVDLKKGAVVHEIEFDSDCCCCCRDIAGWGCLFNNNIIILHDFETIKLVEQKKLSKANEVEDIIVEVSYQRAFGYESRISK